MFTEVSVQANPNLQANSATEHYDITVHGAFALRADVAEEKRSRIVRANGGGLLFSAAREMLISVASRSAHGPLEPAVFDPRVFLEKTPARPPTVAACFGLWPHRVPPKWRVAAV